MFNSEARYINNKFNLIWKIIFSVFSIILSILLLLNIFKIVNIIPISLYLDVNNPWMVMLTNFLFFGTITTILIFLYMMSSIVLKNKCLKIFAKECKRIIEDTKLPEKKPKVLYVYTTHNDLIKSRVIQNMKQTYKNFEVWVSDGSSNLECREKNKKFCLENNINYYELESKGSKNKADNLNQFLKWYKKDFDYLLIGDADEVFHPKFVEYAVKIFCSNKIKNLSYITPLNINYRSKGIYPNTSRILETSIFYWGMFPKNFTISNISPLAGQSCLISKISICECNGELKFDDGNLEDWYLESKMIEKNYYGFILPNATCYYEPDVNVSAHFNRIMRIEDWRIRWWKVRTKKIISNYNEKYTKWYKKYLLVLTTPIIIFLSLGFFGLFVWIISNYYHIAFENNILFWVWLSISIFSLLCTLLTNSFFIKKPIFNIMDYILFPFIFLLWSFASNIKVTIHWFNSLFLGKYSEFGGSGKSRFFKGKNKNIKWWLSLFVTSTIIIVFNSCIFLLTNWWDMKWLIIFFDVYSMSIFLGVISYLILWYINLIPYNNSFDREKEIECIEIFDI